MQKFSFSSLRPILITLLLIIWLGTAYAFGSFLSPVQQNGSSEKTIETNKPELQVYFLKKDGLYFETSKKNGAEKMPLEIGLTDSKSFDKRPPYVIGGSSQTKLYFLHSDDGKKYNSLQIYDLESGETEEIETAEKEKQEIRDLVLSPDGEHIAYILGISPTSGFQEDDLKDEIETVIVRSTSDDTVVDTLERKFQYTIFGLREWFDDQNLVVTDSWEGEAYLKYEIGSKTPYNDLANLGFDGMGGKSKIVLENELGQFGFKNNQNQEITGDINALDGIFFQTDEKSSPQYINNQEATEVLPLGDQFYFLAQISDHANQWQNYGVDLYRTDFSGKQTERLTQTGETGIKKQFLRASRDGRFLTYNSFYSADVTYNDKDTMFTANSSWVYDTQLGLNYKIADQALFPSAVYQE